MRRLFFLACTAAIGTGIFWMIYDTNRSGSQTSSLESPSIRKKSKNPFLQNVAPKTKGPAREMEQPKGKIIRSIPPQVEYTWPTDSATPQAQTETREPLEIWAAKPHFREVKNIVPPIAGVHPPASATLVTEDVINKGGILNLGFNAFLHLPADALVDEWGNPIHEPVKISYCPLSDPIDIYLSGVPMTYDTAGTAETFRTAGMVRLEAETWSGKQVRLKKGESMRLDMPTVATSDDFNFYTFNENTGAWSFDRPSPPARPVIDLIMDTLNIQYPFDLTPFSEKFADMKYHYLTNSQVKKKKFMLNSGKLVTTVLEKSMREALYYSRFASTNLIKLIPTNAIIGYTDDHKPIREIQFKLSFAGKGSFYFRELRHFSGFSFASEDIKTVQEFYKRYRHGRKFHDMRVEYEKGEDYCTLVLKDEKEILRLKARISRGERAGFTEMSKVRFMFAHQRYERDLKKKETMHDELIRKEKRILAKGMIGNRGGINVFMGNNYRQLSLPGFATYNCDQIAIMVNAQQLPKKFVSEKGSKISPEIIIVCDAKVGATFNFYKSYNIDPACSDGGLAFILVNSEDKTYYMSGKEAREKINDEVLELKELPEIENGSELRSLLLGG